LFKAFVQAALANAQSEPTLEATGRLKNIA
jgi:hypothetical protein